MASLKDDLQCIYFLTEASLLLRAERVQDITPAIYRFIDGKSEKLCGKLGDLLGKYNLTKLDLIKFLEVL